MKIIKLIFFALLLSIGDWAVAQQVVSPLFKIGIVADVQYCPGENHDTRHYRASVQKLYDACAEFQKEQVDWIISLGDFIDRDFESFDTLNYVLQQYAIPVKHVIGNHDFAVNDDKKQSVPGKLGLEERYYSVVRDHWRFLFLDGTDISMYGNPEGSEKYVKAGILLDSLIEQNAINAHPWNGAIGEQQQKWIKHQMKLAIHAGENVIVSCHFPIYPDNENGKLWNASEIRTLLESFPGKLAFFNGHNHQSNFTTSNGIEYVSFGAMVEGDKNSFAVAEFYRDSVRINGFGDETNRSVSWEKEEKPQLCK